MTHFELITSACRTDRGDVYRTYGICALDDDRHVLASYYDIGTDAVSAEHLVRCCNEGKLSLIHLPDIVEDARSV